MHAGVCTLPINGGRDGATEGKRSYNRAVVMQYAGTNRYTRMDVTDSVWDSNVLVDQAIDEGI